MVRSWFDWSFWWSSNLAHKFTFMLQDLEFKIIYVGSAETYEFDQVLDQIVVDAVPQGQFKFMFQVRSLGLLNGQAVDSVMVNLFTQ